MMENIKLKITTEQLYVILYFLREKIDYEHQSHISNKFNMSILIELHEKILKKMIEKRKVKGEFLVSFKYHHLYMINSILSQTLDHHHEIYFKNLMHQIHLKVNQQL